MSNETLTTKIALLEQNHQVMMDKLNEFQQDNKDQHAELKNMIIEAMNKKADKETVDEIRANIRWVVYTVVGAVLLGIMSVIMK